MSAPSSNSKPVTLGKSTAAMVMTADELKNRLEPLPPNKEFQFLVTMKSVQKHNADHNESPSLDSRDHFRSHGKIIKEHNKLFIKADDDMKAKTMLNAFRMLASSNFDPIDDLQVKLTPDPVKEPPCVKNANTTKTSTIPIYVNKKRRAREHQQQQHKVRNENKNHENAGQPTRLDKETLDESKQHKVNDNSNGEGNHVASDDDSRLTGGNDNKLPIPQCDCPCSRRTKKERTRKKLRPYFLCACCMASDKSKEKVVKSSATRSEIREPGILSKIVPEEPKVITELPVPLKTSESPAPLKEPPPTPPPLPSAPIISFCDENTCSCRSSRPVDPSRRRLARAQIFGPIGSADGLKQYNKQGGVNKDHCRLEKLEKQMDVLRLELGTIRQQLLPEGEAKRYSQLDARLQELNVIIKELKSCCPQGKDSYGTSSGVTQVEKFERKEYYSQVPPAAQPQQPQGSGTPIHFYPPEQFYENRKCSCSCDSDMCGKKKLAMCFFGKPKKCPYGTCRCGLGPALSPVFKPVQSQTRPESDILPGPQQEKLSSKPESEQLPGPKQEKSSSGPFVLVAPPRECPCGGNMNTNWQEVEGVQCICDVCRCAVPQGDARLQKVGSKRQEPTDKRTQPMQMSSDEAGSEEKPSKPCSAFDKLRCCSHSQRSDSFERQEPGMYYIEASRFPRNDSMNKVVLSRKECSCVVEERETTPGVAAEISYCRNCNKKAVPLVKNNLAAEVLQRIDDYDPKDVSLFLLQESDRLYHINLVVSRTGKQITCMYANDRAVRKATEEGFFKQVRTFYIVDSRHTAEQKQDILSQVFEYSNGDS